MKYYVIRERKEDVIYRDKLKLIEVIKEMTNNDEQFTICGLRSEKKGG